ncbi:MAG TPA: hypothetical protein VGN01_03375 [Acidobacteriaceae bacterium]|jgi:hypothetical protein
MNESHFEGQGVGATLLTGLMSRRFISLGTWISLVAAQVVALPQQPQSPASSTADVMVVAVDRDNSVLAGGIGTGKIRPHSEVGVVPLAWLSPSGQWIAIQCDEYHPKACHAFERDYLKKPHSYTVVSPDGRDAIIHVAHMALDDECFGYGGQGTSSGVPIAYAAVAADSPDIFTVGDSAKRLPDRDAEPIRKAFAATVGGKLDSTRQLRVYSLPLEGQEFFVMQRAYQDYGATPDGQLQFNFILAIGTMSNGRFHLLSWQNKSDNDENEQILGTIHLKSGRDFLVNTVSHPEGQYFRIYGIRNGKLALIYSGGGGSC